MNPKQKDALLKLISDCYFIRINRLSIKELCKALEIDSNILYGQMKQFENMGFIVSLSFGATCDFMLRMDAIDFMNRGGFVAQEQLLKANIELLLSEITDIKQDFPKKAQTIASISEAILSAIGLFA